jgi:endonuclease III
MEAPDRNRLLSLWQGLSKVHLHKLLPLESALPVELRPESRDKYRTIMTMILSQGIGDRRLAQCLGPLFKEYPSFESLRSLDRQGIRRLLGAKKDGGIGLGFPDPDGGGSGARLLGLRNCYFGPWDETATQENIEALSKERGFGPKMVRALQAYCFGNRDVFPLDQPAYEALRMLHMYGYGTHLDEVRKDVEGKLCGENLSLVDFHEVLRFIGQVAGKSQKERNDVVVGWNAWRLLCSEKREQITRDRKRIREHLVQDKYIAEELWRFFQDVAGP